MCCLLVSGFLTEITQQIHSLRASGVMSSHFARANESEMRTFRKSTGTLWTAPGEIAFLLMNFILHRLCRGPRDADRFATEWLLDGVTDRTFLQKRSLGIAIATLTLTALDLRAARSDYPGYPRAIERLNASLRNYLSDEDAELAHALAITVLQAHFSIFDINHAIDHDAEFGNLFDALCLDLTRHNF